jgi:hypothetical protein
VLIETCFIQIVLLFPAAKTFAKAETEHRHRVTSLTPLRFEFILSQFDMIAIATVLKQGPPPARQLEGFHHSAAGFTNRERDLVTVASARKFARRDLRHIEENEEAPLSATAAVGTPAVR